MTNLKGRPLIRSTMIRVLSAMAVISLCLVPALSGQQAQAAPPPGSQAATTFTNATAPPPATSTSSSSTAPTTADDAAVTTDKFNYEHGETAVISGSGFIPGSDVTVTVTTPEGTTTNWTVQSDATGSVSTSYTFGDGADGLFSAVLSDGNSSATTVFTDPAAILYPSNDVGGKCDLHKSGWGGKNSDRLDDPLPGNDGDSTYVWTMSWSWQQDIYHIDNLPGGFDLNGGGADTTAPDTPAPTSTTHTTGVWSNNPNITMTWNSVTDPGGAGSGATVQVVVTAKATNALPGDEINILLMSPTKPNQVITYTPDEGSQLSNDYEQYTITLTSDPNGNDWKLATINNLQAGIALKNAGILHSVRATQMYLVVTPGTSGASGVKGYNYYWDTQPPTTFTSGTTVYSFLVDGAHDFYVNAEDNAGNTSAFGTSGQYLIDTQSPTLTKLVDGLAAKNGWYNLQDVGTDNQLEITLTADDSNGATPVSGIDYIIYQVGSNPTVTDSNSDTSGAIGNGKSATQTTTFVIQTLSGSTAINQGEVTLSHSTADVAGNTYTLPTQTLLIDTVNPELDKTLIGITGNKGWYTSNVLAVLTANDDPTPSILPWPVDYSGVDYVQYSVNGASTTETNTNWINSNSKTRLMITSFGITQDGRNTVTHEAYDVAGNSSADNPASDASPQVVKIDTTDPTLNKTLSGTLGNYGWYTSDVDVTLTAADATSGVDYIQYQTGLLDPVQTATATPVDWDQGPATFSTDFTLNTQGRNIITHSATDVAGNTGSSPEGLIQTVKIDSVEPELYKMLRSTTGENGWYTSDVDFVLHATDYNSNPLVVDYSGVDNIAYQVDSNGWVTSNAPILIDQGLLAWGATGTVSGDGVHTLYHEANDVAGNNSNYTGPEYTGLFGTRVGDSQVIKIDATAPTLAKTINGAAPRDSSVNNGWYNASDAPGGTLAVALNASDATSGVQTITYSQDSGTPTTVANPTPGSNTFSTTFDITKQGTTSLTHSTKDMAGNTYVLTAQDVKLDTIFPTLVKSLARTGLDQVTVTLVGADDISGSGIDNIVYSADGGTAVTVLGAGAYSKDTTFVITGTGAHALTHDITDIAGNQFVLAAQTVSIGATSSAGLNVPTTPVLTLTFSLQNGSIVSVPVTPSGTLISDANITSPDGLLTINIPAGTTVLNSDGTPTYLNDDPDIISIASSGTNTPEGYQVLSSFDLMPQGVTFDSPVTLAVNYGPEGLPEGTQPVMVAFNEATGEWVELETAGYIAADGSEPSNTAAARVNSFTHFAIVAK